MTVLVHIQRKRNQRWREGARISPFSMMMWVGGGWCSKAKMAVSDLFDGIAEEASELHLDFGFDI